MWFKASAPGSLMILGEYAVLHGGTALVATIDKRMTVYLSPRADKKIAISSRLGQYTCDITNIPVEQPFQFVLAAIKRRQPQLKKGCDITIESEISSELGFGSSAAVTVATVAVLNKWLKKEFDSKALMFEARTIVQQVQGQGSGADVAACVLGGLVSYQMDPMVMDRLPYIFPLTVVYSGSKTKTADAIRQVNQTFAQKPEAFKKICKAINECALSGIEFAKQKKWRELGQVMDNQQQLMNDLGVNTPRLTDIIEHLRAQPDIFGAKISGSGLGDCAIGLGTLISPIQFNHADIKILSASISTRGVESEEG